MRVWAIAVLMLLGLPLVAEIPQLQWAVVHRAGATETNGNFTITGPAFFYISVYWLDGEREEGVPLYDLDITLTYDPDGVGGETSQPWSYNENPMPVPASVNVILNIKPKSPNYEGKNAYEYRTTITSGAAGEYRYLRIKVNDTFVNAQRFLPLKVIPRLYDSTTGAGLPFDQFNVTVQVYQSGPNDFYANTNEIPMGLGYVDTYYNVSITLRVRDFFGNLLYNSTRVFLPNFTSECTVATSPGTYQCPPWFRGTATWDVPLQVYSFKVYNQKPDQFIKVKLYWNGSGAGEEVYAPNSGLFPDWWDASYTYRQRITINTSQAVPDGYIYNLTLDPSAYLAAGKMLGDFRDVRVVYWNGSAYTEVPRTYAGTNLTWEQQEAVNRSEVGNAAAAWHFEEATGISAADASGNANTGTLTNGPTWTYGATGYATAVRFDGSNDRIEVADSPSLSITGPITLEAWIKTNSRVVQQGILEKYNPGASNGYTLRLSGSGKLFGATIAAGADTQLTGTTTVSTGVWHHAAFVYTGATSLLYLDGVVDGSVASTRNPGDSAESLKIGARGDDEAFSFNGDIDEPRVYNYARTAQQIACDFAPRNCVALPASTTARDYWIYYGNPLAGAPPPLSNSSYRAEVLASVPAAYWPLDAGSGTTAADISGNGNTGTLTSGPVFTTGLHRGGVAFDGSNDYIDVPNSASLNIVGNMITLEAWVLCPCPGTNRQIYSKDIGVANTDRRFASYFDASSVSGFETRTASGTVDTTKGDGFFESGVWMNFILTYDGALMSWYKDGVLQGTQAQTGSIVDSSAVSLNIARFHTGVSFFAGTLDELSIYPRYFSQTEVWAHYNTSLYHPTLSQPAWASLDSSQGFEWFQSPTETVERFLNPGYYQLQIVTDNRTGVQTKANLGVNITEANYYMVSGTNITRFIGDFQSIYSQTQIISNAFRPDVIKYGELLPTAPTQLKGPSVDEPFILIHPFSVLTGSTAYSGAAGTNVTSYKPAMASESSNDGSMLTTLTVLKDTFVFSGAEPALTHVWINYSSNGTNIWESATLPPSVTLSGISSDVFVVTNRSVQTTRISDFRAVWIFHVAYYGTTKRYEVSLSLNNSMNRTVYNPYWYVGFPENISVNMSSPAVKDLDNDAWLTRGQHFEVSQGGFYLSFDGLNASMVRHFFFQFFDLNSTAGQSTLIRQVSEIAHTEYKGSTSYWLGLASFSHDFTAPYHGDLVVKFTCGECTKIRWETVAIVDDITGRTLEPTEFLAGGGSVTITAAAAGEIEVGGARNYRIYFQLQLDASTAGFSFYAPLITIAGFGISVLVATVIAFLASAVMLFLTDAKDAERRQFWFALVMVLGLAVVGLYIGRPDGMNFIA